MKSRQIRRTGVPKSSRKRSTEREPSRSWWRWRPSARLTRSIAYTMIGLAVFAGWFLTPVPIAAGLTILAGIRLWILWREEKQEQMQVQTDGAQSANGTA